MYLYIIVFLPLFQNTYHCNEENSLIFHLSIIFIRNIYIWSLEILCFITRIMNREKKENRNHFFVYNILFSILSSPYRLLYLQWYNSKHSATVWKKKFFVLQKFVKRAEKIIFALVFVCFCFTEISYFLSLPSNENIRKQHLSANAYFP